mmetsp:Transcript_28929/g.82892  ORF Transcript_28929/g.82892 Transcript_28929/m.82892 type:complete len:231 (-) Transcript_28929:645-1337(-)
MHWQPTSSATGLGLRSTRWACSALLQVRALGGGKQFPLPSWHGRLRRTLPWRSVLAVVGLQVPSKLWSRCRSTLRRWLEWQRCKTELRQPREVDSEHRRVPGQASTARGRASWPTWRWYEKRKALCRTAASCPVHRRQPATGCPMTAPSAWSAAWTSRLLRLSLPCYAVRRRVLCKFLPDLKGAFSTLRGSQLRRPCRLGPTAEVLDAPAASQPCAWRGGGSRLPSRPGA